LPVKKTSQSIAATKSEATLNTRQMRTRVTSQPASQPAPKATKSSKASTSRPPWK
jgi:hypothetical protein